MYVHIPHESVEIVVCMVAEFAINQDTSSQLCVLTLMRDNRNGNVNVVHFTSAKLKRVCKSVLAAELFALFNGFDVGCTIAYELEKVLCRKIQLTLLTNGHYLHENMYFTGSDSRATATDRPCANSKSI